MIAAAVLLAARLGRLLAVDTSLLDPAGGWFLRLRCFGAGAGGGTATCVDGQAVLNNGDPPEQPQGEPQQQFPSVRARP